MDIDDLPGQSPREDGFGTPLNDSGAVEQVRRLMQDDGIWSQDDALRDADFSKLFSFITRQGVIVQLYLADGRFVLARNNTMSDRDYEFLPLPSWAIEHPRWVVQGLVEYGLASWGV